MSLVRSKAELEKAKDQGDLEIVVEGEFAIQLRTARRLIHIAPKALAIVVAAIAAAPFTFGVSLLGAAALSGVEIALIIAAAAIGIALIMAIEREYEEIEFDPGPPPRLKLRKKNS